MELKKGDLVLIRGSVKYFQDFCFWTEDFGESGKVFEVVSITHTGHAWCKSDGYGRTTINGNEYGAGPIAIKKKYLALVNGAEKQNRSTNRSTAKFRPRKRHKKRVQAKRLNP